MSKHTIREKIYKFMFGKYPWDEFVASISTKEQVKQNILEISKALEEIKNKKNE